MFILHNLFNPLQTAFSDSDKDKERALWFTYTLLAIIVPITCARTSNLLRCLQSLFGLSISKRRFYTFMASPKLPWDNIWKIIWRTIPQPLTMGRLITALDDSINCKTGKMIFGCQNYFDHAAKANQSRYPWSQNIVTVGLLKRVHGRWCCLPLGSAFYFMEKTLTQVAVTIGSKPIEFKTKFEQAVDLLTRISRVFVDTPILVVTDSWFGNAGLLKPLRLAIGVRVQMLSRLRVNAVLLCAIEPRIS